MGFQSARRRARDPLTRGGRSSLATPEQGSIPSRLRELLREAGKSEERLNPHVAPASAQFTRGDRREECPRLTLGVRHRTTTVVPFFRRTLAAHCFARLESRALHGVVVEFVVVASTRWEALDAAPPSPGTTSPGVSRRSSGAPEVGLEGQAREASRQPEKGRVRQHVCRRRRA